MKQSRSFLRIVRPGRFLCCVVAVLWSLPAAAQREMITDDLADKLARIESMRSATGLPGQIARAFAQYLEDQLRLFNGGLNPRFAANMEELRRPLWFELTTEAIVGLAGQDRVRSCSNLYGATYNLPFGRYEGSEIVRIDENDHVAPPFDYVSSRTLEPQGGAWSFEPGGMLLRTVDLVDSQKTVMEDPPDAWVDCVSIIRYRYVGARGDLVFTGRDIDPTCSFRRNDDEGAYCGDGTFGGADYPPPCTRPTQYWSTSGQVALDVSNPDAPVLTFPDGSVEILGQRRTDWNFFGGTSASSPFFAQHQSLFQPGFPRGFSVEAYWTTDHTLDADGNRTRYLYDAATGRLSSMVDPQGRSTSYTRDAQGNVTSITRPGFGGAPLTWTLSWESLDWASPSATFPDIPCYQAGNPVPCPARSSTTLTRLTLPDGRRYDLTYEPWGALKTVETPEGGAISFAYGTPQTSSFIPPGFQQIDILGAGHFDDNCPVGTRALFKRRLVATTVYPMGLSAAGFTTTRSHENETTLQSAPFAGGCWKLQWIHESHPDGKVRKTAICAGNEGLRSNLDGRTFADETWGPNGLVEATYYGNNGAIGDLATPLGTMYFDWETKNGQAAITARGEHYLDTRPTKVVRVRDGVMWTETMVYDTSALPAGPEVRTLGNVVDHRLFDSTGTLLRRNTTAYLTSPEYLARNLIRLPTLSILEDGSGRKLARTTSSYDQLPLTATLAPNLVDVGPVRGNATTVTHFANATSASGGVSTTTRYYDTGEVHETSDARNARTTFSRPAGDWALCSAAHPTTSLTTTNELGHSAITVRDCYGGSVTRVTDPNGQVTESFYDRHGRSTNVVGPGDTAASPTQTFEYYLKGSSDNSAGTLVTSLAAQRNVVRTKDGSADGHTAKTFSDGLGRVVQTRTEVDPATSGGFAEVVASQEYDSMGRAFRTHVPCFQAASDSRTDCPSPKVTTTAFDVLGRATRVTPPGLPATTTDFGGDGLRFLSSVTAPNGPSYQTRITSNVLGQVVETARHWAECPGGACWLATTMVYDAAGRLLELRDPNGNATLNTYDDLGRRLTMKDPDMGGFANLSWGYGYDANGNLTSQTDPKGQTITIAYDALNRPTLRDLPPAGPGEEDVTYWYDGLLPGTCHSCDDHCASTTDTCNPATLTCSHSGTPCPEPGCSYSIAPLTVSVGGGSGSGRLAVTTDASCSWSATSNASWLTLPPGASGMGSGTVSYNVAASSATTTRTGTLTAGGVAHTVNQARSACTVTLSSTSASFAAAGASSAVNATTLTGCAWTAWTLEPWITITAGANGSGTAKVHYTVAANPSSSARTGTLFVGGKTLSISQAAAAGCTFSVSPLSGSFSELGESQSVTVTTQTGCTWTASRNDPGATWATFSPASGTGSGSVTVTAAANSGAARSTQLTVAGQTYTLSQLSGLPSCTYSINPTGSSYAVGGESRVVSVTTQSGCAWNVSRDDPFATWVTFSPASASGSGSVTVTAAANSGAARSTSLSIAGSTYSLSQAGQSCSYSIAPSSNQHASGGGGGNVNVTTTPECAWSATPNVPWLQITSGGSGSGNGTVFYSVGANPDPTPRSGTITIAGLTFTANQDPLVAGNRSLTLLTGLGRYLNVPDAPALDVTGAFTVEAWVQAPNTSLAQQGVVERYRWLAGEDGGFALRLASGQPQLWIIRSAGQSASVQSAHVLTGGWHHLAGVWTGSELKLFVDGRLDASATPGFGPAAGTSSLKIGARGDDATMPFTGEIDEVRLSSGALYAGDFAPSAHLSAQAGQTLGLWRFDDGTANDSSGSGLHGSFVNGANATTATFPEHASLALNGIDSYVQVPSSSSLDITGKITLEAWIKTTSTAANQRIVQRGNYSLKLITSATGLKVKMSLTGTIAAHITSNGTVSPNVWHHVVGVYDNAEMRLYVDGLLDNTKALANGGPISGTGALRIGISEDGSEPFAGKIDEVRITSKASYTGASFTPPARLAVVSGTRGLWRFDRHYVSDTSGNDNHGAFFFGAGISLEVPP